MTLTNERIPNSIEMFIRGVERTVGQTLIIRYPHPQAVANPSDYPRDSGVISFEERDEHYPVVVESRVQRVEVDENHSLVILEEDFDQRINAVFGDDPANQFSIEFKD